MTLRITSFVLLLLVSPGLLGQDFVDGDDPFEQQPEAADAREGSFDDADPWEPFNRRVHNFNDFWDTWLLRPVASGYREVTPPAVNRSVSNFFSNLGELGNIVNNLLQGKGEGALISTGRFVFNSTFGVLGLFDVASHMELERQNEDFGQTLAVWGVGSGPYLVLPFAGPSTPRDATGMGVDYFGPTPSVTDYMEWPDYLYLRTLQVVDLRAGFIPAEQAMSGDPYIFIRNAYLQRREYQIQDGEVRDDPFADGDDDFLDDF